MPLGFPSLGSLTSIFDSGTSKDDSYASTPVQHPTPPPVKTYLGATVGTPAVGTPAKSIYEYPGWNKPVAVKPAVTPKPAPGPKVEPKNTAKPVLNLPALALSTPVSSLGAAGGVGSNQDFAPEATLTWLSNHKGMIAAAAAAVGVAFFFVLKK